MGVGKKAIYKDEKIVYKVVGKRNRRGSNFNLKFWSLDEFRVWKKDNKDLWKKVKPYFPIYKKGVVVYSVPNSLGILCFKEREYAEIFMGGSLMLPSLFRRQAKVIKVRGLGDPIPVHFIHASCGCSFTNLIFIPPPLSGLATADIATLTAPPPIGTIAFVGVEVLE